MTEEHKLILLQAGSSALVFLFLWAVLGNLVFKPFLRLLEEREARTAGDETSAQQKRSEARELIARIEDKLRDARVEGVKLRDERINLAKRDAQKILDRAAESAKEQLEKAAAEIATLKAKAMSEMPQEADRLAKEVVERALAQTAMGTIH